MTTRYMSEYEKEMLDAMQELSDLKIKVKNAEKWIDYAKETINQMEERFFDLEEKYGKA